MLESWEKDEIPVVAEEAEAKEGERGEGFVEPEEPFEPCRRWRGTRPTDRSGAGRLRRVGSDGTGTGFVGAEAEVAVTDGVETREGVGVVSFDVEARGVAGAEEALRLSLLPLLRMGGAAESFHSVLSGCEKASSVCCEMASHAARPSRSFSTKSANSAGRTELQLHLGGKGEGRRDEPSTTPAMAVNSGLQNKSMKPT